MENKPPLKSGHSKIPVLKGSAKLASQAKKKD
jgi:hypothetical protein